MTKSKTRKTWRAFLGITTELAMTVLLMALALGLCWVLVRVIK